MTLNDKAKINRMKRYDMGMRWQGIPWVWDDKASHGSEMTRHPMGLRWEGIPWVWDDKASYGSSPTCILGSPNRSLEWRGLRLPTWKLECNFEDSRENLLGMHGDYRENLLDILAVLILSSLTDKRDSPSPISSVRRLSTDENGSVLQHAATHCTTLQQSVRRLSTPLGATHVPIYTNRSHVTICTKREPICIYKKEARMCIQKGSPYVFIYRVDFDPLSTTHVTIYTKREPNKDNPSTACVVVCCSVLQRVAVCCSVFAVCRSVLQCVAACCSVLQRVVRTRHLVLPIYVLPIYILPIYLSYPSLVQPIHTHI